MLVHIHLLGVYGWKQVYFNGFLPQYTCCTSTREKVLRIKLYFKLGADGAVKKGQKQGRDWTRRVCDCLLTAFLLNWIMFCVLHKTCLRQPALSTGTFNLPTMRCVSLETCTKRKRGQNRRHRLVHVRKQWRSMMYGCITFAQIKGTLVYGSEEDLSYKRRIRSWNFNPLWWYYRRGSC